MRDHVPPPTDEEGDEVIEWEADWGRCCDVCGQVPCLVGICGGVVVVEASRCAECINDDIGRIAIGSGY